MNNSAQNNGGGACLHCNTMRRTTGVHQTTQTGPVSPIPQNMNNKTVFLGFSETPDYDKTSSASATALRQVCFPIAHYFVAYFHFVLKKEEWFCFIN